MFVSVSVLEIKNNTKNSVSILHEYCTKRNWIQPHDAVIDEIGPHNLKIFKMRFFVCFLFSCYNQFLRFQAPTTQNQDNGKYFPDPRQVFILAINLLLFFIKKYKCSDNQKNYT